MKKSLAHLILSVCILFIFSTGTVEAAEPETRELAKNQTSQTIQTVTVNLPSFAVSINGQVTDNTYSKYPFIVYKDITYIPITYYDSRLLGLQTTWSVEDGLEISITEEALSEYKRELVAQKNKKRQTAAVATGTIRVNGKLIDNPQEPYPLLVFRDITYFPVTWQFAVNEFDWQYQFDAENGLCIESKNGNLKEAEKHDGIIGEFGAVGDIRYTETLSLRFAPQPWWAALLQCNDPSVGTSVTSLNHCHIGLYNLTGENITVLPTDFSFEYQIYKLNDEGKELVYRKKVPFYDGDLDIEHWAYQNIDISYWSENTSQGCYQLVLTHPNTMQYLLRDTQEIVTLDLRESPYPIIFEGYYCVMYKSDLEKIYADPDFEWDCLNTLREKYPHY